MAKQATITKQQTKGKTKLTITNRRTVLPMEIAMRSVGRPPKFESPEEVLEAAKEYFQWCIDNNAPLTITGLAIALGTTRETLMDYQEKAEFSDTIKKLKLLIENYNEMQVHEGNNPAGAIFVLKNFGWKDKSEVLNDIPEDLKAAIAKTQTALPD